MCNSVNDVTSISAADNLPLTFTNVQFCNLYLFIAHIFHYVHNTLKERLLALVCDLFTFSSKVIKNVHISIKERLNVTKERK
jgi:hypothetical protein